MINKILHSLEHLLKKNKGKVICFTNLETNKIYSGFECGICGKIENVKECTEIIDNLLKVNY